MGVCVLAFARQNKQFESHTDLLKENFLLKVPAIENSSYCSRLEKDVLAGLFSHGGRDAQQ